MAKKPPKLASVSFLDYQNPLIDAEGPSIATTISEFRAPPGSQPQSKVGSASSIAPASREQKTATPTLKTKTRRRDEVRSEIAKAVAALAGSTGWKTSDKDRCRLVDQYLEKQGLCKVSTLRR